MIPDHDLTENGVLVVTGSTLRAEQADRPLAYQLKSAVEQTLVRQNYEPKVVVLSDLWYLNSEALHRLPMISVGGAGVNAASAHLFGRLPNALVIDNVLLIQMDPNLEDLRACVWGTSHKLTVDALEIFISKGYLERFLGAVAARSC